MAEKDYTYTVNIQSDGKVSLTIRTDNEQELERLLEKWQDKVVVGQQGKRKEKNGDKPKHRVNDDCPECNGKLIKRTGSKGSFLACDTYPDCRFTSSL